ncbi:MAG: phosphatase PAP2 family protein [Bacteriodetes bacterium]|nr:phosphatase PAP2 family protein [Bacteroidota bacterium]
MKQQGSLISRWFSHLIALDVYILAIMGAYSMLALMFMRWIPQTFEIIATDIVFAIVTLIVANTIKAHHSYGWQVFRRMYVVPMIYPMYNHTQFMVPRLNWHLYDYQLIQIDRFIFGTNPTHLVNMIANPYLTEYLQLCYVLFYIMFLIHTAEIVSTKQRAKLVTFGRMIVFSFLLSYVAYFAFPAIGPRFTLHNFFTTESDLPGVLITPQLRQFVNVGGGIISSAFNPADIVNRDCMPSGHTMLTLINIVLAWRYRSKMKWLFTVLGVSLIFATIYLRYHYVIDVLAGIACALLMFKLEPIVYNYLLKRKLIISDSWLEQDSHT